MRGFLIVGFIGVCAATLQGYQYAGQPQEGFLPPVSVGVGNILTGPEVGPYPYPSDQGGPLITKHFFVHNSAEEEEPPEVQHKEIVIGRPRKNFNVVFIKSPTETARKTKLRITSAPSEDKTVVYVLTRKAKEDEIITDIQEAPTTPAKPEVFFIKYKTREEAAHAQQQIQAQYDQLGGSTLVSNEVSVPVTSVIGSLDVGPAISTPSSSGYLPPAKH